MIQANTQRTAGTGVLISVLLLAALLMTAGLMLAASPARAQTTFTVTTTSDAGAGSLRQSIVDANANPGADTIEFDIPSSGVRTIFPRSPLPQITDTVTIDGYSQPGALTNNLAKGTNAILKIQLDGSSAGASADGLSFESGASNSIVKGLVINRFDGNRDRDRIRGGTVPGSKATSSAPTPRAPWTWATVSTACSFMRTTPTPSGAPRASSATSSPATAKASHLNSGTERQRGAGQPHRHQEGRDLRPGQRLRGRGRERCGGQLRRGLLPKSAPTPSPSTAKMGCSVVSSGDRGNRILSNSIFSNGEPRDRPPGRHRERRRAPPPTTPATRTPAPTTCRTSRSSHPR